MALKFCFSSRQMLQCLLAQEVGWEYQVRGSGEPKRARLGHGKWTCGLVQVGERLPKGEFVKWYPVVPYLAAFY